MSDVLTLAALHQFRATMIEASKVLPACKFLCGCCYGNGQQVAKHPWSRVQLIVTCPNCEGLGVTTQ